MSTLLLMLAMLCIACLASASLVAQFGPSSGGGLPMRSPKNSPSMIQQKAKLVGDDNSRDQAQHNE